MGLREAINRNPAVSAVVIGLLLLAFAGYALQWGLSDRLDPLAGSGRAFYSIDDGKTFFTASSDLIAPFQHEGKQAVQAMVYTADGGKTRFVGYLMRFTPRGAEQLKAMRAKSESGRPTLPGLDLELQKNTEVKRPGDGAWVRLSDIAAAGRIMNVEAPRQPGQLAEPVDP